MEVVLEEQVLALELEVVVQVEDGLRIEQRLESDEGNFSRFC